MSQKATSLKNQKLKINKLCDLNFYKIKLMFYNYNAQYLKLTTQWFKLQLKIAEHKVGELENRLIDNTQTEAPRGKMGASMQEKYEHAQKY